MCCLLALRQGGLLGFQDATTPAWELLLAPIYTFIRGPLICLLLLPNVSEARIHVFLSVLLIPTPLGPATNTHSFKERRREGRKERRILQLENNNKTQKKRPLPESRNLGELVTAFDPTLLNSYLCYHRSTIPLITMETKTKALWWGLLFSEI